MKINWNCMFNINTKVLGNKVSVSIYQDNKLPLVEMLTEDFIVDNVKNIWLSDLDGKTLKLSELYMYQLVDMDDIEYCSGEGY